jgi:predicted nucleic acid-binding protein
MIVTFVDSGVLIAAARGASPQAERAMQFLDDPDRQFVCNSLVRLEVLPKALHNARLAEAAFYRAYFASVLRWVPINERLLAASLREATRSGTSAVDAIHLVSAASARAAEFLTTERPTSPIFRTKLITVRDIVPALS